MIGDKKIIEGRYWNTCGIAISVVASVVEEIDWAAYIGATSRMVSEEESVKWTKKYGAKLSESDARYYFPDIELPYRA